MNGDIEFIMGCEPDESLEELRQEIAPEPFELPPPCDPCEPTLEERVDAFKAEEEDIRETLQDMADEILDLQNQLDAPPTDPLASLMMVVPDQVNYIEGPEMAMFASRKKGAGRGSPFGE